MTQNVTYKLELVKFCHNNDVEKSCFIMTHELFINDVFIDINSYFN